LVLIAGCAISALLGVVLWFAPSVDPLRLYALSGAWGMSAFTLYAVAVAHTNDFARPDQCVVVSSGLLLLYGAGAVVGPTLASALMSSYGPGALFGYTASVHGALGCYAAWRMSRRSTVKAVEQVPFVESLQSAKTFSPVFEDEERRLQETGVGD